MNRKYQRPGSGSWTWLIVILAIGAALLSVQQIYTRKHLPLIKAGVAAADAEGTAVFEKVGVPAGSQPLDAGEKHYGAQAGKSMRQETNTSIQWLRVYEAPGSFEEIVEWYRVRLLADGWGVFQPGPPSTVQREFRKGMWLVTIEQRAYFSHPPRTRIAVRLEWNYWLRQD